MPVFSAVVKWHAYEFGMAHLPHDSQMRTRIGKLILEMVRRYS